MAVWSWSGSGGDIVGRWRRGNRVQQRFREPATRRESRGREGGRAEESEHGERVPKEVQQKKGQEEEKEGQDPKGWGVPGCEGSHAARSGLRGVHL